MPQELQKAYDPTAIEDRWAAYWVSERLFDVPSPENAPENVAGAPVFTMLLPPPNVTGNLHMGHMFEHTESDILVRWHRMLGHRTLWLPGTDHAGIATQMLVERKLKSEDKSRQEIGREAFEKRVWEWKEHYGGAILEQMKRLGTSVDWSREYFTMDENLSRAVREAFVRLYEQGLIYRGAYIVNWCPDCQTAISDLEVVHEEQQGKLWEIRYPVLSETHPDQDEPGLFVTVATTRPETMLGDTAVAVNPDDERYKHLHGRRLRLPLVGREIPVVTDSWVTPEFGTGAVKVTPAHDPNDFAIGQRHGLPAISVMDETAHMNAKAGVYAGLDRYEARKRVLADLEAQGLLGAVKDHVNSIGKCDRSKTVVEPRLSTQWFVKIQPLADKAIAAVEQGYIRFTPEQYAKTYFGWMRNIYDWCISRQLWWGHRIPGVALRDMQADHGGAGDSGEVRALRERGDHAGDGRARHMVLVGAASLHRFRLAGAHARSGCLLSHATARNRIRHTFLLGGADDHVRLPLHARCADGGWVRADAQRCGAVPRCVYSWADSRRGPPEDVEDQRQRDRSDRSGGEIRHGCGAVHAGGDGLAGHGYCSERRPHRRVSRLCEQDLERGAVYLHERRAGSAVRGSTSILTRWSIHSDRTRTRPSKLAGLFRA